MNHCCEYILTAYYLHFDNVETYIWLIIYFQVNKKNIKNNKIKIIGNNQKRFRKYNK